MGTNGIFVRYASIGFVGGCLPNPNASLRSFGTRLAYLQGKQSFPLTPSFLNERFAITLSLIVSRAVLLIMHLSQFFWIFFCIITRFTSPIIFIIVFITNIVRLIGEDDIDDMTDVVDEPVSRDDTDWMALALERKMRQDAKKNREKTQERLNTVRKDASYMTRLRSSDVVARIRNVQREDDNSPDL